MPSDSPLHFTLDDVHGVAVARINSREILGPDAARELGEQLAGVLRRDGYPRLLLDFHKTDFLSSTAFAVLLTFAKAAEAAGTRLKVCGLQPPVRVGADIIGLGRFVAIFDDEPTALQAF